MSFLSSMANLFRSKPEQSQEPSVSLQEQKEERPSLYIPQSEESNVGLVTVFEAMLKFVDLPNREKSKMVSFVQSSDSSWEAITEAFSKFNLQGRFRWSEFDYWLNKLGEERLSSLSYSAGMYICGGSEGFVYEPITRETLESHDFPLAKLKTAAETVGIETTFKRTWKSFEDFFGSLSETDQDRLLEEASKMHRQHYLAWKAEHPGPDKVGDYWLYQVFCHAIRSRAESLRFVRENIPLQDCKYPDASTEENQDWLNDKNCPWQENYGPKNPFSVSIQRTDIEQFLKDCQA